MISQTIILCHYVDKIIILWSHYKIIKFSPHPFNHGIIILRSQVNKLVLRSTRGQFVVIVTKITHELCGFLSLSDECQQMLSKLCYRPLFKGMYKFSKLVLKDSELVSPWSLLKVGCIWILPLFLFFPITLLSNSTIRSSHFVVFCHWSSMWAWKCVVLRYNAGLCESITREVGGEVRTHRIQMWNVVWDLRAVCYFCWWGRNPGHRTTVTHTPPGGFVGLIHWKRSDRKCPLC